MRRAFVPYVLATIFVASIEGYSLKLLWQWFIAGPFHIYRLSIPQAVGITVLVGLLSSKPSINKDDLSPWDLVIAAVFNSVTALVVGGICYMLTW